ncbi:hypothetical protein [Winogradskyella sp.]|uniref:hypothetical protein n=1 Tax=Winogradskyella sp. TaxID=1883156 RepID=UPI0025DB65CB|nr:hypothetical protein [Winogradskyella sp.]
MNNLNIIEQEINKNTIHLKYLKFEMDNDVYSATLNDLSGHDIVRGYGKSIIEAINDMHRGLI